MNHHKIYLAIVFAAVICLTVVFNFFPRSTFSQLERRELSTFPKFSLESLKSGEYTKAVSAWFSDSEPYRDNFMTLSMLFKDKIALSHASEDNITIHQTAEEKTDESETVEEDGELEQFHNAADEKTKLGKSGTIVIGAAPNARALMIYGGVNGGNAYAKVANKYADIFGPGTKVYVMVIPSATEYYLPEKASSMSKPMITTIKSIHEQLKGAIPVDVYTTLGKHSNEPIFLRTDHHWAHLGAYYAARKFCEAAGVHVPDLKEYDKNVIHNYVGTMYGYSKDIAVKNSPEDFVYYTPKNKDYTTTYITYSVDKDFNINHESKPVIGEFFAHFKDGSSNAYCTFMGGDTKITQVRTKVGNGRRVLVMKDSFGNAIPSWLFGSFEEVHVIDFRYFNKNMKKYVADNKITDILFANNVFMAYSTSASSAYDKFLTQ